MNAPARIVLTQVAGIVGGENASFDPTQLSAYEIDGVTPGAIARPGSAGEVAEIVRMAAADKFAVIATGARTKLGIGMPPARYDLAIDMTRLDGVVAYDPGDLTLGVEAGIPVGKLSRILAEQRQFLPLAVPFMSRTTIGGTIATGVDGPLRQSHGTARDFVLGMEFVTGEGVLAKSGGRVVKNVTGYDLHKLMIGALGTLGIITKVNFRTFPLPTASRGFVAAFDTMERALDLRQRIVRSPLAPMTLDILSPRVADLFYSDAAMALIQEPMRENVLSNTHWALTAGFAGRDALLTRYENDLCCLAEEAGAASVTVLDADLRPAWNRRREFIPIALTSSRTATILKLSVLPSQMKNILARSAEAADGRGLPWAALIRGGGVIYFALLPADAPPDSLGRLAEACKLIFGASEAAGGRATIPWCPTELKRRVNVWGEPHEDFALMQKVKKVFDPRNILAPGRFAGGL